MSRCFPCIHQKTSLGCSDELCSLNGFHDFRVGSVGGLYHGQWRVGCDMHSGIIAEPINSTNLRTTGMHSGKGITVPEEILR